jgi:hypothetical protein
MRRSLLFAISALVFVVGTGCWGPSKRDASNVVISKIEEFKRVKGRLPNSLSETGVEEEESCPCYCKTSNGSYIVWYGTMLGESDTYDSETRKWSEVNGVCSPTVEDFHKQLSPAEKQHILDGPFRAVMTIEDMPAHVKQAFAKITGESSFALANPGQKYQVTDVVVDRGLPRRRLVFAGVRGDEWFVHYELGGIGHSYCVLLFKVDPQNRVQFVWGGAGSHGARNLDQLRKMVAAGQFSDEMQNYW